MIRHTILCALLLIAGTQSLSAKGPEVVTENRPDNSVVFYLKGADDGMTRTVVFNFSRLNNANRPAGEICCEARSSQQRILTLMPVDKTKGIEYAYKYRVWDGRINPKVDTTFVYRMPVSTAGPVRVLYGVNVMDRVRGKDKADRERLGTHFDMQRGDTVYAVRRGRVVGIERSERAAASDVSFTTESSDLTVEHPDGSFAWYVCIDKEHILVEIGDEVLPGTPIALAGSYDGEEYQVSVQHYYLVKNPDYGKQSDRYAIRRHFFPPFATTEGAVRLEHGKKYTAVMNDWLLLRELSKKELKRLTAEKRRCPLRGGH